MFFKVRDIDGERSKNGGERVREKEREREVSSAANRATSGYSLTFLWPYFRLRERERVSERVPYVSWVPAARK